MKCRSMRDNLVFTTIQEHENKDTEQVLKSFLRDRLAITDVSYERVHRIGRKIQQPVWGQTVRPPVIVAKFTFFKDRERIRKSAKRLKGTHYGTHEQFPEEIEKRRKPFYPLLRQARRDDKKAVLVKDKLFVNGTEVLAGSSVGSTILGKETSGAGIQDASVRVSKGCGGV